MKEYKVDTTRYIACNFATNVLVCKNKNCNLRKRPISGGISLWKLLFESVRFIKKLKFPTCGDIEPTSFEDCRSNTVILWCRWLQVTPFHWQKWMLSFQDVISPKGSWVILALNSSNANRSVSLFPPTTKKPQHKRRIKACMDKEEDGGAELLWESPICNMVEEAVGTIQVCLRVGVGFSKQNR